jgi:uncharacterized protein
MGLLFEWDLGKARANLEKHGVSFEEAQTAFADPLGLIYDDPRHSEGESREMLIGQSAMGRLLLVCFTEVPEVVVRIISSREPTRHERRGYEEGRQRGHR